jgi:PAS domain S-box-containing protein
VLCRGVDIKEKYRILLNDLNQVLWQIDKEAITTFVNRAMADMLGYAVDEMLGRPLFSFMDQRNIELAKQYVKRRQQGVKEQHEFEFLRKDGTLMYSSL